MHAATAHSGRKLNLYLKRKSVWNADDYLHRFEYVKVNDWIKSSFFFHSFKTKGNLTKHLRSKAHYKRCMEMGIVPVPTVVDESHVNEEALAMQVSFRNF